ncbi:MAG TPA: hypothetical protein VMM93_05775, partial [Vicinamibacterales bacterium]|nr:hypothetical protein [Vicinamibacterales bacterium]
MLAASAAGVYAQGRGFERTVVGAVYTMTNATTGNEILVFNRRADDQLEAGSAVATGGLGTGAGLGNQGALAMSDQGRWLFAVNAASDSVSMFRIRNNGLELVDVEPSGGTQP